jgi:AraC family cel operon transcriptional repressor
LARKALLGAPMPPCVRLSSFERQRLSDRLDALHAIPRAEPVRVQFALRCLLFELCTQYFGEPARPEGDEVPEWLVDVRKRMLRCDDLRAGLPRLLELSRRSHEYVCRAFRKHFGQTPGDFVCEVRLNYAATLLRHTQSKIATVAYDSGYNNLGHFYQQFQQRFGITPSAFRAAGGAAPNDAVPKRRRAS